LLEFEINLIERDVKMTIRDIVENQGLCFQEHKVTTEDGYILTIHRVATDFTQKRTPVFLQHGMISSSENFMLNSCDSLSFQIARAGYDVWLGNNRGSIYSKEHINLDYHTKDSKFFDYSFYELGKFDLPAQINHVLQLTGNQKLTYIGHS